MNPPMLEASEDLTNLSHLNEPAGAFWARYRPDLGYLNVMTVNRLSSVPNSPPGDQTEICPERDIHI